MKQIKTIRKVHPEDFDQEVNDALSEGWTLVRRCVYPSYFIAELEREFISEAERSCDNCKYCDLPNTRKPCADCEDASHWEEGEE